MELKTKYNVGNKLFFMAANKVEIGKVMYIRIDIKKEGAKIYYSLDNSYATGLEETIVFDTKEGLLNSL